jgi:dipeptidyl aminopeptidase/acylaminoacyl peptidase
MCAYGRTLAEPKLSPDGTRVAYLANVLGRGQLVVTPAGGGAELTVTSQPAPAPAASYGGGAFDWMPDSHALVYAGVDGGLWLVGAAGGPSTELVPAPATGKAAAPAVSPDGASVAFVIDQHHVAVASIDPERGAWPVRLSSGADFCFDPVWSPDSSTVAWHEWDVPAMPWDSGRIMLRPADGGDVARVIAGGEGVQVQQPRFSPDGSQLAFLSDEHGWLNLWVADAAGKESRPLLEEEVEHGDPSWGLGQRSYAWSPDGAQVAFTRNERGFGSLHVLDADTGATSQLGRAVHGGVSWVGERIAAIRSGARTPTQIVVYQGGERVTIARGPVGGFEEAELVEPEAVEWQGDDGGVVHGRLYRPVVPSPTGEDPPPLLVWIHGGPTGQWPVTFIPRVTYFVERGWAVLLPDHRGSTGHGRAYAQAMRGLWGELDVADVAAGMRAAADRGWVDARRMVPMGGSAGGFTVLNLLAHHPELCAAGIDLFGVADLLDLDETTHRFEAHYLDSVVGSLPGAADAYRARSPVNVAEKITAPLLILQGDADPVVPPAQSQSIADRLRALGRVVELQLYEGESHGWLKPETVVDELGRVESFLRRHVLRWRS